MTYLSPVKINKTAVHVKLDKHKLGENKCK